MSLLLDGVSLFSILFGIGVFFARGINNMIAGIVVAGAGVLALGGGSWIPLMIAYLVLWVLRVAGFENKAVSMPRPRQRPQAPTVERQQWSSHRRESAVGTEKSKAHRSNSSPMPINNPDVRGTPADAAELWEKALNELEQNTYQRGLWARCFAECEGDESRAKANYLTQRVQQLSRDNAKPTINSDVELSPFLERRRIAEAQAARNPAAKNGIHTKDQQAWIYKQKIGGWLAVLCAFLLILSPAANFFSLMQKWLEAAPYLGDSSELRGVIMLETVYSVGIAAVGIYVGIELLTNNKLGAVGRAKKYFMAVVIASVFYPVLIIGVLDNLSAGATDADIVLATLDILPLIVWATVGYAYLRFSKRVRRTYPSPETHIICPGCSAYILKETRMCENCKTKLIPH